MSDIKGLINELQSINTNLKLLRKETMQLNKRKKKIEKELSEFIEHKEQPGLKYKNIAILPNEKTKREYKKRVDKERDGRSVLEKYGIQNSDSVLKEVIEAMKGAEFTTNTIKVKKIN